jgi:hypothetical protein
LLLSLKLIFIVGLKLGHKEEMLSLLLDFNCSGFLLLEMELVTEMAGSSVQMGIPCVFNNVVAACVNA